MNEVELHNRLKKVNLQFTQINGKPSYCNGPMKKELKNKIPGDSAAKLISSCPFTKPVTETMRMNKSLIKLFI